MKSKQTQKGDDLSVEEMVRDIKTIDRELGKIETFDLTNIVAGVITKHGIRAKIKKRMN